MPAASVYLDHAATTPLDPEVLDAMLPYLSDRYANASSVHGPGRLARGAVEESREKVAELLGAESVEIVFTSGGTESNNLALVGGGAAAPAIVTSRIEHDAVLAPLESIEARGARAMFVPVGTNGVISADDVAGTLDELAIPGCLVTLMHVNNEIGSVNDVRALADAAHSRGAIMHTDAVQSAGLLDVNVNRLGIDLLSLSAHKFYGPKGAGVLFVRTGVGLESLIKGGPQEMGRRAGTENVAAIVGLARALELAVDRRVERSSRMAQLRDRLTTKLKDVLEDSIVFNSVAAGEASAPHIVNVSIRSRTGQPIDGEMLLLSLDLEGVHVSSGSACSSGTLRPSRVLEALGRRPEYARSAVRFSMGKDTTTADVDYAADRLAHVVSRLRSAEK